MNEALAFTSKTPIPHTIIFELASGCKGDTDQELPLLAAGFQEVQPLTERFVMIQSTDVFGTFSLLDLR